MVEEHHHPPVNRQIRLTYFLRLHQVEMRLFHRRHHQKEAEGSKEEEGRARRWGMVNHPCLTPKHLHLRLPHLRRRQTYRHPQTRLSPRRPTAKMGTTAKRRSRQMYRPFPSLLLVRPTGRRRLRRLLQVLRYRRRVLLPIVRLCRLLVLHRNRLHRPPVKRHRPRLSPVKRHRPHL